MLLLCFFPLCLQVASWWIECTFARWLKKSFSNLGNQWDLSTIEQLYGKPNDLFCIQIISFKQTFTGRGGGAQFSCLSFSISFLLTHTSLFINFSIHVSEILSSSLIFLPAHSSIHVFPPRPHIYHHLLETALLTATHLTRQCWLDSLHKKSLTNSFLIIPETSIHQHLLDLVAKYVLPLPFILLQILLLRFVWWVILYCPL